MTHGGCSCIRLKSDTTSAFPLRDGDRALRESLAADRTAHPTKNFPAILEMIPYRKDDWRYPSDHQRGAYFAQRGYAFCRLDIRGTGSSQGIALDEYTPIETQDGYEAVEWLAAQDWCNGNVGMWGISYGGFTSIQVAMLQPPHLKAIVPMYATDDRYTDDVHYIGGCVTASELAQYAVSQVAMNAMPPKIEYAGDDWADAMERTIGANAAVVDRMAAASNRWAVLAQRLTRARLRSHHLRDLQHRRLERWVYQLGGYECKTHCVNAPRKGLIGNWVHSFPDSAYPGPNLDWLHEMTRFFDYWLKGIDNGVMDEPPLTIFLREYTAARSVSEDDERALAQRS